MRPCAVLLAAGLCAGCPFLEHQCNAPAALDAGPISPPLDCATAWTTVAQPFFTKNCGQCHDWQDSEVDFPAMAGDIGDVVLGCGMPPSNQPQPSVEEIQQLIAWLDCGACANTSSVCSSDSQCAAGACTCGACCAPVNAACTLSGPSACCSPLECEPADGGLRCCSTDVCAHDSDCCSGTCEEDSCICLQVGQPCVDGTVCCSGLCSVFGEADGGTCAE